MDFFQIKFCVRVPLNNTKTIFTRKKTGKTDFYIFVIKWYNIPLMHFASLTLWALFYKISQLGTIEYHCTKYGLYGY